MDLKILVHPPGTAAHIVETARYRGIPGITHIEIVTVGQKAPAGILVSLTLFAGFSRALESSLFIPHAFEATLDRMPQQLWLFANRRSKSHLYQYGISHEMRNEMCVRGVVGGERR